MVKEREKLLQEITFEDARGHIADHFPIYADPQFIARFLTRYELFKKIVDVPGVIVECGVGKGGGLFSWLQIARLLDPFHILRIVIGFDTFAGFPSVSDKDHADSKPADQNFHMAPEYLARWGAVQSSNWAVVARDGDELSPGKYQRVQDGRIFMVKGDFVQIGRGFVEKNPQLICALLYLDFDLYEPTKAAIEAFLPRMPRGSVIAFDELNHPGWPGETMAVMETIGLNPLPLRRIPFEPTVSYAVLG